MKKMKASHIGIAPMCASEEEQWAQIKELRKIGFRASENAEMWVRGADGKVDQEKLKKLLDIGIEPIDVAAFNGANLKQVGAGNIIERAHALGVDKATMFHGAAYYAKGGKVITYDEVMEEIEMLQEVSAACKKEGIKMSYHNHDHEFTIHFKGLSVYDMLLAYAPDLYMELDCGWATYAGEDAPALIRRLGHDGRLALMHFKDYLPTGPVKHTVPMLNYLGEGKKWNMPNFCALGIGALPVYKCLEACAEVGIDAITCEQDFEHTLKGMDILKMDYMVLKESGYVL